MEFFCYHQSNVQLLLPASDYCIALIHCLNCAQRFDSVLVWSWEEQPNIWLTVAKNAYIGWALNFGVHLTLKGTVSCWFYRVLWFKGSVVRGSNFFCRVECIFTCKFTCFLSILSEVYSMVSLCCHIVYYIYMVIFVVLLLPSLTSEN